MKNIYISTLTVFLLFVSFSYAQMGGSSARDHDRMEVQMDEEKRKHRVGEIQGHEVQENIIKNMNHMTGLMKKMVDMMERTSDPLHMRKMAGMMQDLSQHMISMSRIMKEGNASQKEIEKLNQHHLMMQKRFELMQIW